MRFLKTITIDGCDRGNIRRMQPGQWVKTNTGARGVVAGVSKAGVILIVWGAKVADPRLSILRKHAS